ncbi:hypothetical protein [Schleiferia thermophila]|jgi:hypothetical protein
MMLDIQRLKEILARKDKSVSKDELEMLKRWFETNEGLMDFKNQNGIVDSKNFDQKFADFHMDIFDVIKHNDPDYRK